MRRRYLGSVSCDITMSRRLAPFFFISVVQAEQPAKSLKTDRDGSETNKQLENDFVPRSLWDSSLGRTF